MSKLKTLLQWYRRPVGLLWLVSVGAVLAGIVLSLAPLILGGVAVLALVLLPHKDQQHFRRQHLAANEAAAALQVESARVDSFNGSLDDMTVSLDEMTASIDQMQTTLADDKREVALQLNDYRTEVDDRVSHIAAQQVEMKHAQQVLNDAAEETIAGAGRLDAIVHGRIDGIDERLGALASADQVDRLRHELTLLRTESQALEANGGHAAVSELQREVAELVPVVNDLLTRVDKFPVGIEGRLDDIASQLARRIAASNDLADRTEAVELLLQAQTQSLAEVTEQVSSTSSTVLCDGSSRSFYLPRGYRRRLYVEQDFDDTGNEDEWQREVYDYALGVAQQLGAKSVCDFGCGSGFKLVDRFETIETTGIDRDVVVDVLRGRYPDREWLVTPRVIQAATFAGFDLVIASDVIEHLADPSELLVALADSGVDNIILSTPARDLLSEADGHLPLGPPRNQTHFCEWSMDEFRELVAEHLEIVLHRISNRHQATQLIHARPKR